MTANVLRKLRNAITGAQEPPPPPPPRLFNWETFPAASAPGAGPFPTSPSALPASASWKSPKAEPTSSVIGAGIPADVASFATVYEAAGVAAPEHGYGVDRVSEMLNHKGLASMERSVKAKAVLAALDAAGVAIQDVIHDAVLRFQTLTAFEAAKDLERSGIAPPNEARIEELRAEVDAFRDEKNARIAELTREGTAARQALGRLRGRVRAEQDRYLRAVSLFVEPLPARVIPMTPAAGVTPEGRAATAEPAASPVPPAITRVATGSVGDGIAVAPPIAAPEGQAVSAQAVSPAAAGGAKGAAEPKAE
jgi:hypothetical protein